MEEKKQHRHFAILWCEDGPAWEGRESVLSNAFVEDSSDTWEYFKVPQGQLPDLDTISKFNGIIITGSRWSVYDDHEWIKQLKDWIARYREVTKKTPEDVPRLAGICFGAQALGTALGGRVGPNETSPGKFAFGAELISLDDKFSERDYVKAALAQVGKTEPPKEVRLLESHGDAVNELPPEAELLASSVTTKNEVFTIGDHIFAIQGHPEFTNDILEEIIPRIRGRRINEKEEEEAVASMALPNDHIFLRRVIRRFLDRDGAK